MLPAVFAPKHRADRFMAVKITLAVGSVPHATIQNLCPSINSTISAILSASVSIEFRGSVPDKNLNGLCPHDPRANLTIQQWPRRNPRALRKRTSASFEAFGKLNRLGKSEACIHFCGGILIELYPSPDMSWHYRDS